MSSVLDSGYGVMMLRQLRDDAEHYAKTEECLRCKRWVEQLDQQDFDEVNQFLAGVTLYCMVCGDTLVMP